MSFTHVSSIFPISHASAGLVVGALVGLKHLLFGCMSSNGVSYGCNLTGVSLRRLSLVLYPWLLNKCQMMCRHRLKLYK